jgi:hypothetical protein
MMSPRPALGEARRGERRLLGVAEASPNAVVQDVVAFVFAEGGGFHAEREVVDSATLAYFRRMALALLRGNVRRLVRL